MHYAIDSITPPDIYRLLTGGVVPRPIAWVSTQSASGVDNLAPFSFFTVASVVPPVLAVVQVNPPNRPAKDTLINLRETKECVVNVVTHDVLDVMNASAGEYAPEVSEFDAAHIARCKSKWVVPPGVQNTQIRYECRLRDVLAITDQPMGGSMMLLDVVGVTVNDDLLRDGVLAPALVDAVGKLGADLYCSTRGQMERKRPMVAAAPG